MAAYDGVIARAAIPIALTARTPIRVLEIYDLLGTSISLILQIKSYLRSSTMAKPAKRPEVQENPDANPS